MQMILLDKNIIYGYAKFLNHYYFFIFCRLPNSKKKVIRNLLEFLGGILKVDKLQFVVSFASFFRLKNVGTVFMSELHTN